MSFCVSYSFEYKFENHFLVSLDGQPWKNQLKNQIKTIKKTTTIRTILILVINNKT